MYNEMNEQPASPAKIMTFKAYCDLQEFVKKERKFESSVTYFDPSLKESWVLVDED